jgi:hypothetical protein
MSKLETNTIDTISGSTNLTLGGTNATDITIPSGVTLTNNGTQAGLTLSDNILFNAASKGIYLGVTSATASNLLDDYEEGTWTPSISAVSGFTNTNVDSEYATYTKIGNMVYIRAHIQFPDSSGNVATGNYAYIQGLPFSPSVQDNAMMNSYRYNNANNASAFVTTATTTDTIRWVVNYVLGSPLKNGGRVSLNFMYKVD